METYSTQCSLLPEVPVKSTRRRLRSHKHAAVQWAPMSISARPLPVSQKARLPATHSPNTPVMAVPITSYATGPKTAAATCSPEVLLRVLLTSLAGDCMSQLLLTGRGLKRAARRGLQYLCWFTNLGPDHLPFACFVFFDSCKQCRAL